MSHIRNTGLKFRVQSLWQKFISFERMWLRIAREIEEGTYSRDLFKARMRSTKREKRATDKPGAEPEDDSLPIDEEEMAGLEGGGDLASALAEAAQAVEARKAAPKPEPKVEPPAPPADLVRPAAAEPPRPVSSSGARPPPPPAPPGAPARNTGNFPALKGPPPPPAEASRPLSNPNAPRPPPPPGAPALIRPASSPNVPRPPAPPPVAGRPVSNPGAVRPPPPPGAPKAGVPDEKMRAIFNAYVAAKKQCRESTDGITLDAVAKTINQQVPELMKQHGAKAVDFKVVIKNGKATLKAVPRT
jgi:hypothetical protein